MAHHRVSEVSFSSDLADELDRIEVREDYELDNMSQISQVPPTPIPDTGDQDEERLLSAYQGNAAQSG